jgi:hypothetical protein
MEMFRRVDGHTILMICTAENPHEEDDGLFSLYEVSEFNADDCLMFAEKTKLNKGLKELIG